MENDILQNFRGLLTLGRVLGLVSVSTICKGSIERLRSSIFCVARLTSLACAMTVFISEVIEFWKHGLGDIVHYGKMPLFSLWGLFLYIYFHTYRHHFMDIFKSWTKCNSALVYTRKDAYLRLTIVLVCFVMFSSTILENAALQLKFIPQLDDINGHNQKYGKEQMTNSSALQIFCRRTQFPWTNVIGEHPIFCLWGFISYRLVWYSINYTEVLLALFGRALYFQFQSLNQISLGILRDKSKTFENLQKHVITCTHYQTGLQNWNQLTRDHDSLCSVLDSINNFFSPVIFVSYSMNICFLCLQILDQLNPDKDGETVIVSIYTIWSFIHIIARIFLISLFWARVNEHAHKTRDIVIECPLQFKSDLVTKLEKRVSGEPKLGLNGLGCFTVTKPFMLSIVNVVFTVEIVLLQSVTTANEPKTIKQ